MRLFPVMLGCLMLVACGKTGALYLPEEETEAPEASGSQAQDAAQQNTQSQDTDTTNDGTTD